MISFPINLPLYTLMWFELIIELLENVKKRDYIDSNREESPLRQADDALVLDNSHMTLDEQKAWLLEQYHKAIGS